MGASRDRLSGPLTAPASLTSAFFAEGAAPCRLLLLLLSATAMAWTLDASSATATCPKSCHCSGGGGGGGGGASVPVVQCTSRDLERIPSGLPRDTAVLLLSSNRIRHIPGHAFRDLPRLRELDLSYNVIESVEATAFQGTSDKLRTLDLSNNRLRRVPKDTFSALHARIRLSDNPWHCECSLQEMLRELRLDPETVNQVSCSTSVQEEYAGQPVIQVLDAGINLCNFHQRTTDVAMLVAMFCWFSMVIAYVIHYVRQNQEDARRHMEYLKTLPGAGAAHLGAKDYDTASSSMV